MWRVRLAPQQRTRAVPIEIVSIEREDVTEIGLSNVDEAQRPYVGPYKEAVLTRPYGSPNEIHLTSIGALSHLAELVAEQEGPVHIDEVISRIKDAWGVGRAGGRIRDAVERAVIYAVSQGFLINEESFLWRPGTSAEVRDRSQVQSAGLRKPEMLPPTELCKAILQVVQVNFGATRDQVAMTVSRDLGFKATSAQLRGIIDAAIGRGLASQELVEEGALLVSGPGAGRPPPRPVATQALLALIAGGESERLEFKQTLRFDIETQSLNKKLEEVVIKTVAGFTNQAGGTLLIGVSDDGVVTGIEPDYATLTGGNRDKFELHLTHLLNIHFGPAFRASRVQISLPVVDGKVLCRVDVQRSPNGVVVKMPDRNGNYAERFYVRMGNSTQDLSLSQMTAFMSSRRG